MQRYPPQNLATDAARRRTGLVLSPRLAFHGADFRVAAAAMARYGTLLALSDGMNGDALSACASPREVSERRRAVEALRALAKPHRFRVQLDVEGFPVISGRYGQIEWFDGESLAVYTTRPRLFEKLWAIPGVRRHQTGDAEMRAVFPPEALEQVAAVVKARRRRTLSPEEARRRGFKPHTQSDFRAVEATMDEHRGVRIG